MDPLTHAASGAAAMLAMQKRPATAWCAPLAALACASPDIDLAFISTPLQFLELHRGITHSFAFMPFFALLLSFLCRPLWNSKTPFCWKFHKVWLFCCAMILLHIWLDVVTTYGTMVFIPFSHYRVRLNSIYIIDLLVTVPLLLAIFVFRKKKALLAITMIWIFVYPASGIVYNKYLTGQCEKKLAKSDRSVANLHILPDAFAPFFWRAIFEERKNGESMIVNQSLNIFGNIRKKEEQFKSASPNVVKKLKVVSTAGDVFFNFAMLPVMTDLPLRYKPEDSLDNAKYLMFYDLRFGSDLEFVQKLLKMRPDADLPFIFMAELLPDTAKPANADDYSVNRIRLRFADSGKDSFWHKPIAQKQPNFWQWLAGLQ